MEPSHTSQPGPPHVQTPQSVSMDIGKEKDLCLLRPSVLLHVICARTEFTVTEN